MSNGRLTSAELSAVQGDMSLAVTTANAWRSLVAACRAATGVTLTITHHVGSKIPPRGTGAYRDYDLQVWMYANRSSSTTGSVAYPGTSVHGWGRCVDIGNWGDAAEWLRANSTKFGFSRTIPTEPWHFQHNGTTAAGGGFAGVPQEETMSMFDDAHPVPNPASPGNYLAVWFTPTFGAVKLTSEEWAAIQRVQQVAAGAVIESYPDVQVLSRLIQRASAEGIVAQIDAADEPPALIDPSEFNIIVPTAQEIADAVVDEQAERLQA